MTFRKTEAITISQNDYSETSQVLTFYTSDYGKLTVLARGIKRPKHRLLNPPDLFSHSEIIFINKSPQGMNLLTEITVKDDFPSLRINLARLRMAFYIARFLNELTEPEESNPELFNLVLRTVRQLDAVDPVRDSTPMLAMRPSRRGLPPLASLALVGGKGGAQRADGPFGFIGARDSVLAVNNKTNYNNGTGLPNKANNISNGVEPEPDKVEKGRKIITNSCSDMEKMIIFAFETQALKYLGYMPNTLSCPICKKTLAKSRKVAFSFCNGSILCPACRARQFRPDDLIEVSAGVMKLVDVLSNPFLPDLKRLKITRSMQAELRGFINKYITYIANT